MTSLVSEVENTAILEALLQGGQEARKATAQDFEVFEKGREDYVTTIDQSLDRYFAQTFAALFPHDGIITEENQGSAAAFHQAYDRLWCIDPIDGTEEFIHRGEHYAVMVGLLQNQQPRSGWIYAPAQQRCYWGGPDWGLFQRDRSGHELPLAPCPQSLGDTHTLILGDRDQRRFGTAITTHVPSMTFDAIGSFGLKVMEVIKGQAGLYIYLNGRVKLWDTTGPIALALAAGLTCCDLDGEPIRFDANSVYPRSLIHRQPIVIGWPDYVREYLSLLRQAVIAVRNRELSLQRF